MDKTHFTAAHLYAADCGTKIGEIVRREVNLVMARNGIDDIIAPYLLELRDKDMALQHVMLVGLLQGFADSLLRKVRLH